MAGEADVLGCGHHDVGDDAALQAAHPVRQHLARHPAEDLEALRQHRQRRLRLLVRGEPHEPDPRPRQHRAEHVQPALSTPVDHQMLTRRPHRRPPATVMLTTPGLLALRDQPPEVPRRPRVAGGLGGRQQPLRRDPPRRRLHPPGHQLRDSVIVMATAGPPASTAAGLMPRDHPFHGLVRRAAKHSGAAVSAHLPVGRNDVHPFPRRLQWKLPGRCGDWLTPPPSPPGPQPPGRHDERGMGTFTWPPAATSTRPHTGTFSRPWTPPVLVQLTRL